MAGHVAGVTADADVVAVVDVGAVVVVVDDAAYGVGVAVVVGDVVVVAAER